MKVAILFAMRANLIYKKLRLVQNSWRSFLKILISRNFLNQKIPLGGDSFFSQSRFDDYAAQNFCSFLMLLHHTVFDKEHKDQYH